MNYKDFHDLYTFSYFRLSSIDLFANHRFSTFIARINPSVSKRKKLFIDSRPHSTSNQVIEKFDNINICGFFKCM